jgi:CxxC-x17-CxxC domain-containing protein
MTPYNKDRKFGKPSFGQGPRKFGSGPRKFGSGPRTGTGGFSRPSGPRTFDRPSGGRSFERPGFEKRLLQATCASCGQSCEVPFKPSGEKPVYCRNCFQQQPREPQSREQRPQAWHERIRTADYSGDRKPREFNNEKLEPRPPAPQLQQELATINAKLDRILKALAAVEQPKPVEPVKAVALPEDAGELKAAAKPKAARKTSKKSAESKKEAAEPPVGSDEE